MKLMNIAFAVLLAADTASAASKKKHIVKDLDTFAEQVAAAAKHRGGIDRLDPRIEVILAHYDEDLSWVKSRVSVFECDDSFKITFHFSL